MNTKADTADSIDCLTEWIPEAAAQDAQTVRDLEALRIRTRAIIVLATVPAFIVMLGYLALAT